MNHFAISDHEMVNAHMHSVQRQADKHRLAHIVQPTRSNVFQAIRTRVRNWFKGMPAQPTITLEDIKRTTQEIMQPNFEVQRSSTK